MKKKNFTWDSWAFDCCEDSYIAAKSENKSGFGDSAEAQEARGQKNLVNMFLLPKKIQLPRAECGTAKEKYIALGFNLAGYDTELFQALSYPRGYSIKATEHPMWNDLLFKGKKIASIFYKASFHDYNAFIRFEEPDDV